MQESFVLMWLKRTVIGKWNNEMIIIFKLEKPPKNVPDYLKSPRNQSLQGTRQTPSGCQFPPGMDFIR